MGGTREGAFVAPTVLSGVTADMDIASDLEVFGPVVPIMSYSSEEEGLRIAKHMYERHELLTNMLVMLGVSRETAMHDACKIEHDLSDETFEAIKRHVESALAQTDH